MTAPRGTSQGERMTLRFHLHCLAGLLPYATRNAALETWLASDAAVFSTGFDPPAAVLEPVVEQGGTVLRTALARSVRDSRVQNELIDLDEPEVDAALAGNHGLGYGPECRPRLRNASAVAAGRAYHPGHLRRALLSADPDLAAVALVDQRAAPGPAARTTDRATAWATVRRHGGTDRVRAVVATLPPGTAGPLDGSAESARHVLRTTPVRFGAPEGPTPDHVGALIESGRLPASEVAELMRPAHVLTSWVGQASGHGDLARAAWCGRAALHVATAALLARWADGDVPAERWAALGTRIREHPGSLPELLRIVGTTTGTQRRMAR